MIRTCGSNSNSIWRYLSIQQFNPVAMNFSSFPSNVHAITSNLHPFQQRPIIDPKPSALTIMALVLAMDFSHFENLIRKQIILEGLAPRPALQVQENKRPSSLPERQKASIPASEPLPQTTQKVPEPKITTLAKPQLPKNTVVKTSERKPQAPVKKGPKLERQPKVQMVKNKKKQIQKIQQVRKQNPKRQPEVCLLDAAECSKRLITQREKRRIRERLLMRQVHQWDHPSQQKRDRRDLRPQY